MQTGLSLSLAGHAGLIAWAIIGGYLFAPERTPPPDVTEVTLITSAELDAFAAISPNVAQDITPLTPTPPPVLLDPPAPDPVEPPPQLAVLDAPEAPDAVPTPPAPPPSPAPRIAPTPAPAPPTEARPADTPQEATTPNPDAAEVTPDAPQVAEAPEEAATEIVPEGPKLAPTTSARPASRPDRPRPQPTETPDPLSTAVAEALEEATQPPPAPIGPPLSSGEEDALRVSVQRCWNIGSLSSEATRTTVTVSVEMTRDAKPVQSSIRLIGSDGGSDAAVNQAFEAARRAIIRCGLQGYGLPEDKYAHWQTIEMIFNPERMRFR